jgi:hypothetical protein
MEKQKKNQWDELEILVNSVTKLQPHFITPWLFQSWNLAYNVSVECDRTKDKYFYIADGIGLLAEGNRKIKDNPDMRLYVGIYTQNKMGISDENITLRSLYQMSCIPPAERNPARFRRTLASGQTEIRWQEFEDFCKRHPFLVRRLHDVCAPDRLADLGRVDPLGNQAVRIEHDGDFAHQPALDFDGADIGEPGEPGADRELRQVAQQHRVRAGQLVLHHRKDRWR